jgi:hypothetical protein
MSTYKGTEFTEFFRFNYNPKLELARLGIAEGEAGPYLGVKLAPTGAKCPPTAGKLALLR